MQVCACMQEEDPASTRADEPSEAKTASVDRAGAELRRRAALTTTINSAIDTD